MELWMYFKGPSNTGTRNQQIQVRKLLALIGPKGLQWKLVAMEGRRERNPSHQSPVSASHWTNLTRFQKTKEPE